MILATPAPDVGGVSRHMFDLAAGLQGNGHDVSIAVRPEALAFQRAAVERGVPWLPLSASARTEADIWHIHVHNTMDRHTLPLMLARSSSRSRSGAMVITEHLPRDWRTDDSVERDPNVDWKHPKPGARWARTEMKETEFRLARRVIAVSEGSSRFLKASYRRVGAKVEVVHNGVTTPATPQAEPAARDLSLVFVGALTWRKGLDVLLEALALGDPGWELTVVGDGPARADLESLAARLHVRVHFVGWSTDPDPYLVGAHALVLPSRAESFGYAPLEAMAQGRPVVATRVDGPDELVVDGETGILVEPGDPKGLCVALWELAGNEGTRRAMGRRSHLRAAQHFSIDAMVRRTEKIYQAA